MRRTGRWQVLAVALAAAGPAAAQVDCTALPNPLYLASTTDMKPFYARVATKLSAPDAGTDQMTLVYRGNSSCAAYSALLPPGAALTGTASYWEVNAGSGVVEEKTCTFPASPAANAHVAVGDVTVKTCTGGDTPAGLKEFQGFAQAFGFIVPPNSQQQAITADEAYFVFKYGGQPGFQVPPWTDPAYVMIRSPAASTQLLIGLSSGVLGTQWSAALTNASSGASALVAKVAAENTSGNADKTLGILSTQVYDGNRDKVRMLAFQAADQKCLGGGVYPDSTAAAFDKRNVRDGHYEIWGYAWFLAPVDGGGQATDARARAFLDFVASEKVINGASALVDGAQVGAIPRCAMAVQRRFDGGPLEDYQPTAPCGCYFEALRGTTGCEACPAGACAGGKVCRHGYCEER